jgi:hypothetical protein
MDHSIFENAFIVVVAIIFVMAVIWLAKIIVDAYYWWREHREH